MGVLWKKNYPPVRGFYLGSLEEQGLDKRGGRGVSWGFREHLTLRVQVPNSHILTKY